MPDDLMPSTLDAAPDTLGGMPLYGEDADDLGQIAGGAGNDVLMGQQGGTEFNLPAVPTPQEASDEDQQRLDDQYRLNLKKAEDDDALAFMERMKGQLGLTPPVAPGQGPGAPAPVPSGGASAPVPDPAAAAGQVPAVDPGQMSWISSIAEKLGVGPVETPLQALQAIATASAKGIQFGQTAGKDITTGLIESPLQSVSGVFRAYEAASQLGEELLPLGGIQIYDKDGNFSPDFLGPEAWKEATKQGVDDMLAPPEVREPTSVTGGLVRGIAQFMTGFYTAGKVFQAVGYGAQAGNAAQFARSMLQAASSDFAAFDGQEKRLSNLIQEYPALQNPVTEFLAAENDDPEIIGRLKNVVEGAIPDTAFAVFLQGLRAMRSMRRLKALSGADTVADAVGNVRAQGDQLVAQAKVGEVQPEVHPDAGKLDGLLGPEQGQAVIRQQDWGVPDDVVARGVAGAADDAQARGLEPQAAGEVPPAAAAVDETLPRSLASVYNRQGEEGFRKTLGAMDEGELRARMQAQEYPVAEGAKKADLIETALAVAKDKQEARVAFASGKHAARSMPGAESDLPAVPRAADAPIAPRAAAGGQPVPSVSAPGAPRGSDPATAPAAPPPPEAGGASKIATPKGELYINWARIDTGDGVKAVIRDMAESFRGDIAESTRGVRSNLETKGAASKIDAFATLMGERKIPLPSAEEQLALRQLWTAAGEKSMELGVLAARVQSPENLFAMRKMLDIHAAVQREVIGIRTETARALQQWRIPASAGAERLRAMQEALDMTGGNATNAELARIIASVAGKPGADQALNMIARKSAGTITFDALREIRINSMLSGPKTQIVNSISNTAVMLNSMVERAIAGQISDTIGSVDGVRLGEATAMMYGVKQSLRDAARAAWQTYKTGAGGAAFGKVELPHVRSVTREALTSTTSPTFNTLMGKTGLAAGLEFYNNALSYVSTRPMAAADEFFKTINYRAELWAVAFRQASEELDRGIIKSDELQDRMARIILDPPDNVSLKAERFAEYNTFTNDPGEFTKRFLKLRETPGFGGRMMQVITPFVKTPSNILQYTFERTPMAPLMGKFRAEFAAGGARRQLMVAKIAFGSAVMATAYDMGLNAEVTGSGPKNPRERQALLRTGWQPYSIKVNGRYYKYNRFDPIGFIFGLGGDFAEFMANDDGRVDADWEEAWAAAVASASDNMMDKSYFRGFAEAVDAASGGDVASGTMMDRYLRNLAASFVPNAASTVAQSLDPYQKYTSNLVTSIKAKLPGYSKDVPNKLDFWGRPISYQSGLGSLYDALSPIYSKPEKPEPIDKELLRIKYYPTAHAMFIRVDGENVNIRNRPEVITAYHKAITTTPATDLPRDVGNRKASIEGMSRADIRRLESYGDKTLLQTLNEMVESPDYQDKDDSEKEKDIQEVIRTYRAAARIRVLQDYPILRTIRAQIPSN